jgi:biotin carboxyl carrier protein
VRRLLLQLAARRAGVHDGRPTHGEANAMAVEVEAQITGKVWKIEVAVGAEVEEEDVLLILESMKMEIPVEAPSAGRVAEFRVEEGQSVEEGDVLAVLE